MASSAQAMYLVVEDDDNEFFLMDRAMKRSGTRPKLHRVCDGADAIEYLSGEGKYGDRTMYPFPGLLLLDLKMPKRNGYEVLQWIRAHPKFPFLPVIVLSSYDEPEDVRRAYELGANSFIPKPGYDVYAELVSSIQNYWSEWNEGPPKPAECR